MSYNTEGKATLNELEGAAEIFTDLLSDIGIYDLEEGSSLDHGTYKNTFTCLKRSSVTEGDTETVTIEIQAQFYEVDEKIIIKMVRYIDPSDGSELNHEVYWFDEAGNDNPEDNSNWSEILENLDIFLDEI